MHIATASPARHVLHGKLDRCERLTVDPGLLQAALPSDRVRCTAVFLHHSHGSQGRGMVLQDGYQLGLARHKSQGSRLKSQEIPEPSPKSQAKKAQATRCDLSLVT